MRRLLPLLLLGCGEPEPSTCALDDPFLAGNLDDAELDEASGLAAGPGVLWSHNDGDDARLFAVGPSGEAVGRADLGGPDPTDLEDIALGAGPGGAPWLHLGDIGGDGRVGTSVRVYRVPLPDPDDLPDTLEPEWVDLDWPDDRPHDAEALLIDGTDWILVTRDRPALVLRIADADRVPSEVSLPLERVTTLAFGEGSLEGDDQVRGGDALPGRIVLRTADTAFVWDRPAGVDLATVLMGAPCAVPLDEEDGEAVALTPEGLVTTTEGLHAPLVVHPLPAIGAAGARATGHPGRQPPGPP